MTELLTAELAIREEGVYSVPVELYHLDPVEGGSLSSTGARRLLLPSCPAKFKHLQDHAEPPKKAYDLGHAAHKAVLTEGEAVVVVEADDWRTKDAREQRDRAYDEGKVPILAKQAMQVEEMADQIRNHPIAGALFRPGSGKPEQTLVWQDRGTGIWRRALLDWLPDLGERRRLIVPDYKTCAASDPDTLQKTIARWGYHVQAAFYLDGIRALELSPAAASFVFVFQETEAPYVVTVVEPDVKALAIGRAQVRKAIATYRECMRTGRWPGYADDVVLMALPPWVENEYTDDELEF